MFPVVNLHRVDCRGCRSNLDVCVQWDVPLTLAEIALEETTGPQPPVFMDSEGEDDGHLESSPLPASPQHWGEVLREDEDGHLVVPSLPASPQHQREVLRDNVEEQDEETDDDRTPQGMMLQIVAHDSNLSILLPAASTEGQVQFFRDSARDSLNKLVNPVYECLQRERTNFEDAHVLENPATSEFPGEGQSASTTCTGTSLSISNESDKEEEEISRTISIIRSVQAKHPKRRQRFPRPFDNILPEYGRDHPLVGMTAWKADAWGVSFRLAGDTCTPGWYPIYNKPPSTDASSTPNPDVSVTAQDDPAQHSSWPGNGLRAPEEVRAHSSSAAPTPEDQSCRNNTEQSSSRKRGRETNSPSSSHSSEEESSPSKLRRREDDEND